jgi:hypothetical protein
MNASEMILAQLGGAGRVVAMTGAQLITKVDGLGLRLPKAAARKINHVEIGLSGDDTYRVVFWNVSRTGKVTGVAAIAGVYAEQLAEVVCLTTGLALKL